MFPVKNDWPIMLYYHPILDSIFFCKLVFFQLGLVLYFYLDLFHCRPHLFESVFFLVKNWISFE